MAGFSVTDLIQSVVGSTNQANQVLSQAQMDLESSNQKAQNLFDESVELLRSTITGNQQNQQAQAEINYQQQKTVEQLQNLYNLNPENQSNEIATSLAAAQAAKEARQPIRQEIDQLNSIDFLSNPVGWLMAQTKLPALARQNNALADKEDEALQNINAKTTSLQQAKSTVVANTADATRQVNMKAAQLNADIADAKLDQATAENIVRMGASRMQAAQLADKIQGNNIQAISAIANLQNAEENRLMRLDAAEDRKLDRALRREQLEELLKKKKDKAEEDAMLDSRLKDVSDSLGLKLPMTMDRIRTLTDKESQEQWLTAATTGRYGSDLLESVQFYQKRGSTPEIISRGGASIISTAQKLDRAGAGYVGSVTTAYRAANPTGKPLTDKQSRELAYGTYQAELAQSFGTAGTKDDLSSPKWDRVFNPYVADFVGFTKAVGVVPQLAPLRNNEVVKTINTLVDAGAVKGENLTSEQQKQVLSAVQQQVLAKKITPAKAAADISAYFNAATRYNAEANKADLFAIPRQSGYLFTMPSGGRTNLLDPAQVERTLIKGVKEQATVPGQTPFGFR